MTRRLPLVLSVLALVVALLGFTPVGESARQLVLPKASVGAKQLKSNAVTSPKIKDGEVRNQDLAVGIDGAKVSVGSLAKVPEADRLDGLDATAFAAKGDAYTKAEADARFQARAARGTALAGVVVNATGVAQRYFNTLGGAPVVSRLGVGWYNVSFPGVPVDNTNAMFVATPETPSDQGTAINVGTATNTIVVLTKNSSSLADADRGFNLVVYGAGAGG